MSSSLRRPGCVWLENLSIQLLCREEPQYRCRPVAFHNGRQRIAECNGHARMAGIVPGMRVKEATALHADLALFPQPPAPSDADLLPLAEVLLKVTPRVGSFSSEELVVDFAPALHLHGNSEAHLAAALAEAVAAAGFSCRIAVADSLAAARLGCRLLAKEGKPAFLSGPREVRFVEGLPLEALASLPEFFAAAEVNRFFSHLFSHLGLKKVRDLVRHSPVILRELIPEERRELLLYAARSPEVERRIRFLREWEPFVRSLSFSPPIIDLESLLAELAGVLADLERECSRTHRLVCSLHLALTTEHRREVGVDVTLAQAGRNSRRLLDLCRLRLAQVVLPDPLAECRVSLSQSCPEPQRDVELFSLAVRRKTRCDLAELENRLEARLGRPTPLFRLAPPSALIPEAVECAVGGGGGGRLSSYCLSSSPSPDLPIFLLPPPDRLPVSCTLPPLIDIPPVPGISRPVPLFELERFDLEAARTVRHAYATLEQAGRFLFVKEVETDRYRIVGLHE
ncbi:MAG: hypothetical protein FJ109_09605 [Deltaproteobacteria bacterium]|nr:hypothetical protein [Deltaproteobacteria bacterium]